MAKLKLSNGNKHITPSSPAPMTQPRTGRDLRQLLHGKSNQFRAAVAAFTAALGGAVKHGPRNSTIEKINKLVRKFGVEALMAGCDRATAPPVNGGRRRV